MTVTLAPRIGLCCAAVAWLTITSCSTAPTSLPPPSTTASERKLDAPLQAAVERVVKDTGRAAAVIALEPDTGNVRAFYSVPGERGDPLLVADLPASTFKAFVAVAGLETGALTPSTTYDCTGTFAFDGKQLTCPKAHGHEDLAQSLARSCNTYYYSAATKIDPSRTLEVARRFGFGIRTGIELADEPGSLIDETRAPGADSAQPLLDAVGHGQVKVTLLQLARAFAVFANGGHLVRLSLNGQGTEERPVALAQEHLALVRRAMVAAVESPDGTAHGIATPGFAFAGKTGGLDAPPLAGHGEEIDTIFVAFAPVEHPKILVAAKVQRAKDRTDAQLATKAVLDAWRAAQR